MSYIFSSEENSPYKLLTRKTEFEKTFASFNSCKNNKNDISTLSNTYCNNTSITGKNNNSDM